MANVGINKLVIIGVGLIGGSFALALRKAGCVRHVVGVGRSRENMQRALARGAIDEIAADLASALSGANVIFLALPVGQTDETLARISSLLEPDSIVTDAGSTKQDVIAAARLHLPRHLKNFVPGHPVAGAERSGASAADTELFQGRNVVLTPLEETGAEATQLVAGLWQACGATVSKLSAARHDHILAAVSHLPHVLAFALMSLLSGTQDPRDSQGTQGTQDTQGSQDPQRSPSDTLNSSELLRFAGSGFRDFTRIAGSSPEMWRDICLGNRETLLKQMDAYQRELAAIRDMLARGDGEALEKLFANARETRRRWLKKSS